MFDARRRRGRVSCALCGWDEPQAPRSPQPSSSRPAGRNRNAKKVALRGPRAAPHSHGIEWKKQNPNPSTTTIDAPPGWSRKVHECVTLPTALARRKRSTSVVGSQLQSPGRTCTHLAHYHSNNHPLVASKLHTRDGRHSKECNVRVRIRYTTTPPAIDLSSAHVFRFFLLQRVPHNWHVSRTWRTPAIDF